jgi:hypothetical protein
MVVKLSATVPESTKAAPAELTIWNRIESVSSVSGVVKKMLVVSPLTLSGRVAVPVVIAVPVAIVTVPVNDSTSWDLSAILLLVNLFLDLTEKGIPFF